MATDMTTRLHVLQLEPETPPQAESNRSVESHIGKPLESHASKSNVKGVPMIFKLPGGE